MAYAVLYKNNDVNGFSTFSNLLETLKRNKILVIISILFLFNVYYYYIQ